MRTKKTAGEVLRECRGKQSQEAYAELLGISQTALSNYELGKDEPRIGVAVQIQKVTRGRVKVSMWAEPAANMRKVTRRASTHRATGTDG
jgi:transcriptional regulator with XRE-family HTH domain